MAQSDILRETRKWRQYVEANLGGGGSNIVAGTTDDDFAQWSTGSAQWEVSTIFGGNGVNGVQLAGGATQARIEFLTNDLTGARTAYIGPVGLNQFDIVSELNGRPIRIAANDTGGTLRTILNANPNSTTVLRADTELTLQGGGGANVGIRVLSSGAGRIDFSGSRRAEAFSAGFLVGGPADDDVEFRIADTAGNARWVAAFNGGDVLEIDSFVGDGITQFNDRLIAGDPGFEGASIDLGGVSFDSVFKVSNLGGANQAQLILHRHSTTQAPVIIGARSNSNDATHSIVLDGQVMLGLLSSGWDGLNYKVLGQIRSVVDGTPAANDMPGRWEFLTTPAGSTINVERMRIGNGGTVYLTELAAADGDIAGKGQLWVRNDTPNVLMFTDDAGTDFVISAGGVAGADTQVQFNDGGNFGASANLTWDDNTFEITNTTSADPALRLNVGNNPSTAARIETSLGTGYTVLDMRDSSGVNFFRIRHDTSLSLPNNQFLIENSESGDMIEISQDGEIIFCGYEGDPFVMDGVEQGRFTIQNNATMYMEQVLGAQSDRTNYGQLWVRNPDIALMFTDEVGNDYQITPPGNQAAPATLALAADNSDSVASDITVNNDADLTGFTLAANQTYTFEAYIRFSVASGNGGARWDFNVSAGGTDYGVYSWFGVANDGPRLDEDSRDKVALSDEQTITITSGASVGIRIRGTVRTLGAGATIDFQFAQNVSDVGAITRQRGSWIRFTPIASV